MLCECKSSVSRIEAKSNAFKDDALRGGPLQRSPGRGAPLRSDAFMDDAVRSGPPVREDAVADDAVRGAPSYNGRGAPLRSDAFMDDVRSGPLQLSGSRCPVHFYRNAYYLAKQDIK